MASVCSAPAGFAPALLGRIAIASVCSAAALLMPLLAAAPARAGDPASPVPEGKGGRVYTFAGIAWRTPADSVRALLVARGYREVPGAWPKGRLICEGRLFDHWTTLTGLLDDRGRLVRWEISIPVSEPTGRDEYAIQRRVYDDAVAEAEAKYGRRRVMIERFKFPYERGDGREARALREGYATIRSAWGTRGDRLEITLDASLSVVLVYESPAWSATEKERRRKKAKDL